MRQGNLTFRRKLALIALAGLALRVVYTLAVGRDDNPESQFGDAAFFHIVANLVANGHGFSHPFYWVADHYAAPTAAHPPLWPLVLAVFSKLGADGQTAHRLVGDLVGCGVVFATGLLGARVGGERVGVIAAGIAALYPVLIAADGSVMSEPLCALTVLGALLAAYAYTDRPDPRRAAVLGAAIGLAALTRGEALVLLVLLALPIMWATRRHIAVALAALVVVLAPWTIRNAIVFDRFVPISTNVGSVVGGANCGPAYHGRFAGGWIPACVGAAAPPPRDGRDYHEAKLASEWLSAGRRYAQDHPGRLVVVAPLRVIRTWSLWQPRLQATAYEGENRAFAKLAVLTFFPLALLAIAGAIRLRRRLDRIVLLAVPAMVTLTSLVGYGTYRFRHAAEPALVVLAALAIARFFDNPGREAVG